MAVKLRAHFYRDTASLRVYRLIMSMPGTAPRGVAQVRWLDPRLRRGAVFLQITFLKLAWVRSRHIIRVEPGALDSGCGNRGSLVA